MSRTVSPTAAILPAKEEAKARATPALFALFADSPFADLQDFDEQLAHEKASFRDVPDFQPMSQAHAVSIRTV